MNDLLDRLFDLPARQRYLLLGSIVLGMVFSYLTYFYWPLSGEIAVKQEEVIGLRHDRDRKIKMVADLGAMRKQLADLNAALKQAQSQLPDSKEIPELLSSVSSLGRESGLEVLVFRQREEVYQEFYAEVPVEIRVEGSYHQVATFFDKVGRLNRIVNVDDISMKQPKLNTNSAVILGTSCTATTFRFLDEVEREKIAKEKGAKGQ